MHSQERIRDDLRALCAQSHPDDGINPRDDKRAESGPRSDRKLRQLCKQVERSIQLSLASLRGAEELVGAVVQNVMPSPNAGRLCVIISVRDASCLESIMAIVSAQRGRVRADVAEFITRRRTPELCFEFVVEGDNRE